MGGEWCRNHGWTALHCVSRPAEGGGDGGGVVLIMGECEGRTGQRVCAGWGSRTGSQVCSHAQQLRSEPRVFHESSSLLLDSFAVLRRMAHLRRGRGTLRWHPTVLARCVTTRGLRRSNIHGSAPLPVWRSDGKHCAADTVTQCSIHSAAYTVQHTQCSSRHCDTVQQTL